MECMGIMSDAAVMVTTNRKFFAGTNKGDWVKIRDYRNPEEFRQKCREIHRDERSPEFYYYDWKNIPRGWISDKWMNPLLFRWIGFGMRYLDERDKTALYNWSLICQRPCTDLDQWLEWYYEHYQGWYTSLRSFTNAYLEKVLGIIPKDNRQLKVNAYEQYIFQYEFFYIRGFVYKSSQITINEFNNI